ncbi:3-methyladenine DNA glycosylase [Sulfurospirillum diekertiae]|uniref:3-methyladenine DNA glycosylase n=1 Tax=Sulfurospirillum diekertiae TaxID=1854492 RepID=A0A6G9VP68_9BACT|nr:3-methyladenine DNA glycosylase [Sulfurospirillum diekertiae]QIR75145.1 3-methyladenine DNA glycosylase [Sulfurospirillum diekertiae]QIR77809.1 3-methyladenine DNA glycosylase [Sulfurospirillum diekertiae]
MNSFDLLVALKQKGYLKTTRDPLWWPRSGTFWVIVGAILTQQTKWEKVEISMANLECAGIDSLEKLSLLDLESLAMHIKPSGFYNTKAKNLSLLANAILEAFSSFEFFCEAVDREWLLAQKGIGEESADSILCYACKQEAMVVDAYTARLLEGFDYSFESYAALQEWMVEGLLHNQSKINQLYGKEISLTELYARFHGKIVEFCKENSQGKKVNVGGLSL